MNIRHHDIYDTSVDSNGFAKGTVAAEAYFQVLSGANKFSASTPEVTSRRPCTLSRKTKWQRSFGAETGLCHCLEIFDKLGSDQGPAGGRMLRHAAHVRSQRVMKRGQNGKLSGESTTGEKNSRKRNFQRYSSINPKEHWCETQETALFFF